MSELLFYSKTVPLNRQTHARARLLPVAGDYSFAATVNSVPLADKENPILFSETHDHFRITETFAERLGRLSLLTPYAARFDLASGESFTRGRFLIVDEKNCCSLMGGRPGTLPFRPVCLDLFASGLPGQPWTASRSGGGKINW